MQTNFYTDHKTHLLMVRLHICYNHHMMPVNTNHMRRSVGSAHIKIKWRLRAGSEMMFYSKSLVG